MILGVDIGGSSVKLGVVNDDNQIIDRANFACRGLQSDRELIDAVIRECLVLMERHDVERIGVGSPGYVDLARGVISNAVNLPYNDTPARDWISESTGVPVTVGNDATCAAVGELYAGFGTNSSNLIFVTLGTGIGGGIVINRKIYIGTRGDAGEIGHVSIDINGLECRCGRRGCWELYASANALRRITIETAESHPGSVLAKLVADSGASGRTVFDGVRAGCPVSAALLDRYLTYLAAGLSDLVAIFRPDVIVLGGGLSGEGDGLLQPLRLKLGFSDVPIELSRLRNDAGIIGAALLYKQLD